MGWNATKCVAVVFIRVAHANVQNQIILTESNSQEFYYTFSYMTLKLLHAD